MIEAWLKASETIRSGSAATTGMTPVLQVKPDWNVRAASTCLKRASSASSSSWSAIVPEIVRTAPERVQGCLHQSRVRVQAQVVVGGERDRLAAVHRDPRPVRAAHHVEWPVQALGPHLRQVVGEMPPVSYTHLRAHETRHDLVCRLLLEKKKNTKSDTNTTN